MIDPTLILVYFVFIGALASPGPDLLIVMKNALGYSTRIGVFTAAGIAAALCIHMFYCVTGIALLISNSVLFFNLIKWGGAAYLTFVGIQSLMSKGTDFDNKTVQDKLKTNKSHKTPCQGFINGFMTNLFNPKAMLFFIALFSQMINPDLSVKVQAAFAIVLILTSFTWFSCVAFLFGLKKVRDFYSRVSKYIDRVFGLFFIGLGVKLVLTKMS